MILFRTFKEVIGLSVAFHTALTSWFSESAFSLTALEFILTGLVACLILVWAMLFNTFLVPAKFNQSSFSRNLRETVVLLNTLAKSKSLGISTSHYTFLFTVLVFSTFFGTLKENFFATIIWVAIIPLALAILMDALTGIDFESNILHFRSEILNIGSWSSSWWWMRSHAMMFCSTFQDLVAELVPWLMDTFDLASIEVMTGFSLTGFGVAVIKNAFTISIGPTLFNLILAVLNEAVFHFVPKFVGRRKLLNFHGLGNDSQYSEGKQKLHFDIRFIMGLTISTSWFMSSNYLNSFNWLKRWKTIKLSS